VTRRLALQVTGFSSGWWLMVKDRLLSLLGSLAFLALLGLLLFGCAGR
jgi:hypothetical protein